MAVLAFSDGQFAGYAARRESLFDAPARRRKTERNDLDRQWKATQRLHPFGVVGNDDHLVRGRGYDLFPQQRAAAALDDIQGGIDFVCAIDGEVEAIEVVQRRQPNAAALGIGAGCLRGRDADDVQSGADPLAEQFDEMLRGRTGAEAKLHTVLDMFKRARGRLSLQFIQIHAGPDSGPV